MPNFITFIAVEMFYITIYFNCYVIAQQVPRPLVAVNSQKVPKHTSMEFNPSTAQCQIAQIASWKH